MACERSGLIADRIAVQEEISPCPDGPSSDAHPEQAKGIVEDLDKDQ